MIRQTISRIVDTYFMDEVLRHYYLGSKIVVIDSHVEYGVY